MLNDIDIMSSDVIVFLAIGLKLLSGAGASGSCYTHM